MKLFSRGLLAATVLTLGAAHAGDFSGFRRELILGNVPSALREFDAIPPATLAAKDAAAGACMHQRFSKPPALTEGVGAAVLYAYRTYWHDVLLQRLPQDQAQGNLLKALNASLPAGGQASADLDDASEKARAYLESQGLHALAGVTSPYYEWMMWTQETRHEYQVALPEKEVTVRVVFMDGFISGGWLDYASCGRFGAGGWTADGTLYAIAARYDTASEGFRVNYLAHEGQHFSDNRDFPQLEQPELEYRAKLTELALAAEPQKLLAQFAQTAKQGRAVPHAHAEYWLVRRLRERGANDHAQQLSAQARALLAQSTALAAAQGATSVKRFLPE
jgi:hypothetical protein